ncbi:MAG: hypothetical protein AAF694_16755 [Bacteroidota bacterium]
MRNRYLAGLLITLIGWSCTHEPFEPASSQFPSEVATIFSSNCAISGCHVGDSPPENLNLSSWDRAFQGSDFGAIVIPYAPNWSHLFQHTNTYSDLGVQAEPRMPPSGDALGRDQVLTIREWIEAGAVDKTGTYRWALQETRSDDKLFSLCAGSDLIAVTDLETNLIMRFVEVGQLEGVNESPHYIALSPDNRFMYVTLLQGSLVEKYRTDTYERVGRVEVGESPALIEVDPLGNYLIISHWNATNSTPKLSLLDANTLEILNQVRGSAELLSFGHGMATNSDFSLLYVVANEGNYYAKYAVDPSGLQEIDKILIDPEASPFAQATRAYQPYHSLLSPDGSKLFISCSATNEVRVFNTASDQLITTIPTGEFPRLMAYDSQENRLFVACAKEENFSEQGSMRGCVSVIDAVGLSKIREIYRLGHRPHGIGISKDRRLLFVSSENNGNGNEDPPHHFIEGLAGTPGKYNVVDLQTLGLLREEETEIGVFPNALVVID